MVILNPLPRGLEPRIRATLAASPVVILEGGRAVGKSTLCAQLHRAGLVEEVADLTDPVALEAAEFDPVRFVRQLKLPAIIDEAQLVEPLSLAVKQRVDGVGTPGLFLLTGSSRIGRGVLGGSDPLAGRAARLQLFPFTQGERKGTPVNLIPMIRDGNFPEHRFPALNDLAERLMVGGLPGIPGVLRPGGAPAIRRDLLGTYVEGVLHPATLESRIDRSRLLDVFRAVAGTPALVLNLVTLARDLNMTPPTLRGYLELLKANFLLVEIPALAADARREIKGHPRLMPSDVALASWAGRRSLESLASDPTSLGPLLHSLVVGELLAQSSWAGMAEVLHWRRRNDEVDVVLRFADGRLVGIEIKAARSVNRGDAAGLRTFLRTTKAEQGVIFYLGETLFELETGIWAVPVQALWDKEFSAAPPPTKGQGAAQAIGARSAPGPKADEPAAGEVPSDTALFYSYVHDDDEAEGGRIPRLARDINARYRLLFGEELDVFIDKDLKWGEEWRNRIDHRLARATFFVPVVTRRFLQSEQCRRELLEFVAAAEQAGTRYVLPILFIDPETLDTNDPVGAALERHQGVPWREISYEEPGSGVYRRAVDGLCEQLAERIASAPAGGNDGERAGGSSTRHPGEEGSEDILRSFEKIEELVTGLPDLLADFESAFMNAMTVFAQSTKKIPGAQSPGSTRAFRAVINRLAGDLENPIQDLDQATLEVRNALTGLDEELSRLIRMRAAEEEDLLGIGEMLTSLRGSIPDGIGIDPGELKAVRSQMRTMGRLAVQMRGPTRSFEQGVLLFSDIDAMLRRWRRDIERFGPD